MSRVEYHRSKYHAKCSSIITLSIKTLNNSFNQLTVLVQNSTFMYQRAYFEKNSVLKYVIKNVSIVIRKVKQLKHIIIITVNIFKI